MEANYTDQPFFVVLNDAAYDRMLHKLQNGSRFEWSYTGTCPHKRKADCNCVKFMNVLRDGKIIRIAGGAQKPVYRASDYISTRENPHEYKAEINVFTEKLMDERAEGYAATLKELAASVSFPVTVNFRFNDRTLSAKVSSMLEFENAIGRIVSV